jgi:hypothetical protein
MASSRGNRTNTLNTRPVSPTPPQMKNGRPWTPVLIWMSHSAIFFLGGRGAHSVFVVALNQNKSNNGNNNNNNNNNNKNRLQAL